MADETPLGGNPTDALIRQLTTLNRHLAQFNIYAQKGGFGVPDQTHVSTPPAPEGQPSRRASGGVNPEQLDLFGEMVDNIREGITGTRQPQGRQWMPRPAHQGANPDSRRSEGASTPPEAPTEEMPVSGRSKGASHPDKGPPPWHPSPEYVPDPGPFRRANYALRPQRYGAEPQGNVFTRFLEPQIPRAGRPRGAPQAMDPQSIATGADAHSTDGEGGSASASRPPAPSVQPQALSPIIPGMSNEEVQNMADEPFKIPQIGEWQIDDKLRMARDVFARGALNRYDPSANQGAGGYTGTTGRVLGTAAGVMNYAQNHAAQIYAANEAYDKIVGGFRSREDQMQEMGYSSYAGEVSVGGYGVRSPASFISSPAARQAAIVEINQRRLRYMPYIGEKNAAEIQPALMGEGWSGSNLSDIAFHGVAPLVSGRLGGGQMDPESVALLSQSLRAGQQSIGDFVTTLSHLPTVARGARETVSQYSQSLADFANQMEHMGITRGQAYQVGQSFSVATGGLDPRQAGQFAQNPIFQGMAMARYGVMPSQIGLMGGGNIANNQLDVMNLAMQAAAPFNQDRYQTIQGRRVLMASGQDMQIAQAAQTAGMDVSTFKRLWDNRQRVQAAAPAEQLAVGAPRSYQNEMAQLAQQAKLHHTTVTRQQADRFSVEGGTTWGMATRAAEAAGVSRAEINKIGRNTDFATRGTRLQDAIQKAAGLNIQNQDGPTVNVKFTALAAKVFEQEFGKASNSFGATARAGGTPLTNQSVSNLTQGSSLADILKQGSTPDTTGLEPFQARALTGG